MKFSDSFLASIEKENEGSSSADDYLRYTKLDQGKPANFALLEQDPLEYWRKMKFHQQVEKKDVMLEFED